MTRPLTIAGKPSRELHAESIIGVYSQKPVHGLVNNKEFVCNAAMPNAGPAYPWPHLQQPARAIRGQA